MKPQSLLLIHGMGTFTEPKKDQLGSFGQEFIDATDGILGHFSRHAGDSLTKYFDVFEYNYSAWFDAMRTEMANNAKDMATRLSALSGLYGGTSFPLDFASRLTAYEAKFGGDQFFYTHWLDVIFYGTELGAAVRVRLGQQIADLVMRYGQSNVHIIAHSLGTAVTHDTLALLYRPESDPGGKLPDLHPVNHRLGTVWMFANVSRLVNSVTRLTDPLGSIVRPGDAGCTNAFYNIRHELDPFTWLAPFNPANDGAWLSEHLYLSRYAPIVNTLIVEANTHSFTQYLSDPHVLEFLFPVLMGNAFKTDAAELQAVEDDLVAKSLNGAYASLRDALAEVKPTATLSSWLEFLNAAKAFKDAVAHVAKSF